METAMEEGEESYPNQDEERDITRLCRVCANPNEYLIPIYHGEGLEHDLKAKISRHLPIKVQETDCLPLQLCYQCASTLIAWHDMVTGCSEADAKLRALLPHDQAQLTLDEKTGAQVQQQVSKEPTKDSQGGNNALRTEFTGQDVSDEVTMGDEMSHQREISVEPIEEVADTGNEDVESYENVETSVVMPVDLVQGIEDGQYIAYFTDEYVESNIEVNYQENAQIDEIELSEPNDHFICVECGKIYNNINMYKTHLKTHQNKGHFCPHCDANYKRIDHLSKHIEIMHPKCPPPVKEKKVNPYLKTYLCNTCGKILKSSAAYENHTLKHTSDSPYECSLCPEKFSNKGSRRKHEVKEHQLLTKENGNPDGYHVCEICGAEMFSDGAYYHHKDKHGDPFPCGFCGKLYGSRSLLQVHVKRHTTERPFVCTLCNRNFKVKQELRAHMNIHKDLRPFPCPYCSKNCRKSSDLIHHIRTHTGEKPYICDKCGRGFAQAGDMRKHRQLHFKLSKVNNNLSK